jgi:hypothetical protein
MVTCFQDVKVEQIKSQLQVFLCAQHCLFPGKMFICVCVRVCVCVLILLCWGKDSHITYPF